MIKKVLHTLEYHKILEQLAQHAMFSAGKDLVAQLEPTPYYTHAITLQTETAEARHLLAVRPEVGIGAARDVRPLVAQARRGIIINAQDLLTISRTLTAARDLRRQVIRLEDRHPHLADIAYRLEESAGLVNRISQCIDDSGSVRDNASAKLSQTRREIDIAHSRLQEKLRRLMASERVSQYLQDGFVTQRDGRYVLPLKSDFRGRIKGIIHDQSASGATVFVEPMAIVDLNNRWKQLQLEEEQEINRILASLTVAVDEQGKFIAGTVQALAEIDLIFAKARYAEAIVATAPILNNWQDLAAETPRIDIKAARHPLLDPETVVAIDLTLSADTQMLIITGPNTGGKTVSLKTAGLLTLMAQSGLHIPANDGSQLMVFDGVFADIGDEQSLEQSLSTFSSHMTNIVTILDRSTPQSLVIFDELGAGTDPIEGAALARAILDHLLAHNITTLVATHYAELKAYAYTTPHVENASMAFNVETLSPTFKLQLGLPGNSNAFAIAQRLGLNKDILQEAQGLIGEDAKKTEMMLAQIKADLEAARMERLRLEEERAEAEYYRQKVEDRLSNVDEERLKLMKRARIQAQKELDSLRGELRGLRREAKKAVAETPVPDASTPQTAEDAEKLKKAEARLEQIEAAVEARVKKLAPKKTAGPEPALSQMPRLKVGSKVEVPHLGSRGVVTAIDNDEIEVQLGSFRTTLKRQNIAPLEGPPPEAPVAVSERRGNSGGGIVNSPGFEFDMRGQVSEDALHQMDSYLDQAYLAGLPFVQLIHGKGSGVLRNVVREALAKHPLVSSYRAGKEGEGGEGVTVAKLALD